MSRIPLVDPDRLTGERRAQYDRFPSNLTRTLLLLDDRLAGALPEDANAIRASALDPALREAAILRVAALSSSAYERMQHLDQARKVGWSDDDIAAIEAGRLDSLADGVAAALRLVDAVVAGPTVDDSVFDTASKALDHRDLVTLIVLVGHYMMVARLTGVLEVELDAHADSWTHEH